MNNQPVVRTAAEFVNWGLGVFQERVEANGFVLSPEAAEEFRSVYSVSGTVSESHPRVFDRYWQMVHRVMREQGDLAAMAARWSRKEEVGCCEVKAAIRSHQEIKAGTFLCPWAIDSTDVRADTETVAA